MGSLQATEFAQSGVDRATQLRWHLRSNHFPPVPLSMVPVCEFAIDAANDGLYDVEIELPEGSTFRGSPTAPVFEIIRAHHLEFWLDESDDFDD